MRNGEAGIHLSTVGAYYITSSSVVDNGRSGVDIEQVLDASSATIDKTFFFAHFRNSSAFTAFNSTGGISAVRGPRSDGLRLFNNTFLGYEWNVPNASGANVTHSAIETCLGCDQSFGREGGGFVTTVFALVFINSSGRAILGQPTDMIVDMDGSLLDRSAIGANYTLLGRFQHISNLPGCSVYSQGSARVADRAAMELMVCGNQLNFHRVVFHDVQPASLQRATFAVDSAFGLQNWTYSASSSKDYLGGFVTILPSGYYTNATDGLSYNVSNANFSCFFWGSNWLSIKVRISQSLPIRNSYMPLIFNYTHVISRANVFRRYEAYGATTAPQRMSITPLPASPTVLDTFFFSPAVAIPLSRVTTTPTRVFVDTVSKKITLQVAKDTAEYSTYDLRALACPSTGCIVMLAPVAETSLFWNDYRAWATGHVPQDNEDVTIPPGMTVTLNTNTARLRSLVVQGTLIFHPRIDSKLTANFIVVWGGTIWAGNTTAPHSPSVSITLNADPAVQPFGIDDTLVLEPGTMAIFGVMSIVGSTHNTPWTSINTRAAAGDNELKVQSIIDWSIGDYIVVSSTSYTMADMEDGYVKSIHDDSRGLTLVSTLLHEHLGTSVDVTESEQYDLLAQVGLLSRKFTIEGGVVGNRRRGCRVLIGEYGSDPSFATKGDLYETEIRYCGFSNTTHGAVELLNVQRNVVTLSKNAVHHSLSSSLLVNTSSKCAISKNIFYLSYGPTVNMANSSGNTLTGNLALGTYFPEYMQAAANKSKPYALCTYDSRFGLNTFVSNFASGSASEGFCVQLPNCSDKTLFTGNEAHSGVVGLFAAHATLPGTTCCAIDEFHAFHQSYAGIHAAINADVTMTGVATHDNHISILAGRAGSGTVTVRDSVIGGRAPYFDTYSCSYFTCAMSSLHSSSCPERASVYNDESRSFYQGEIGVLLGPFNEETKTADYRRMTDLPLANPRAHEFPAMQGALRLENIVFANFKYGRDYGKCDGSTILATNGMSLQSVVPTFVSNTTFASCVSDAKVYLHSPSTKWIGKFYCDGRTCDALNHVVVHDTDGTFMETGVTSSVVSSYATAALVGCDRAKQYNAYTCTGKRYGELLLENMDTDAESRLIEPVEVQDQDYLARLIENNQPPDNYQPDAVPLGTRPGRVTTVLQTERTYLVDLGSEMPRHTKWHFRNCPPKEATATTVHGVLLRILYSGTMTLTVWVAGNSDPTAPTTQYIQYTGTAGSNYLEKTDNRLSLLVPCETEVHVHQIVEAKVGLVLATSLESYFRDFADSFTTQIATYLGVDATRISVYDVYGGSTVVAFRIFGSDSADYNSTLQADEVNSYAMKIASASDETLSNALGVAVVDVDFIVWAEGTPAPGQPDTFSAKLSSGFIIFIVAACVVVFFVLLGLLRALCKAILAFRDEARDELLQKQQQEEEEVLEEANIIVTAPVRSMSPQGNNPPMIVDPAIKSLKIRIDESDDDEMHSAREGRDTPPPEKPVTQGVTGTDNLISASDAEEEESDDAFIPKAVHGDQQLD